MNQQETVPPLTWHLIHKRFASLMSKTGCEKSSSYTMSVEFDPHSDEVRTYLGTYDVSDWPRHTYLGPFRSEEEAMQATLVKVIEAEAAVQAEEGYREVYL